MSLILPVTSSEVPSNLECIITDERWQQLVALLSVLVPDGFKMTVSSTAPAPEDRIWPWFRLLSDGKPDAIYHYTSGYWLSKYHTPVNSPIRLAYTDDATSLLTYDGGENAPVSEIAGPFWEIDTAFAGRIPAGVGNLPSFATSGNAIVLNTNDGNDQITLTDAAYRNHRHFTVALQSVTGGSAPTPSNQVASDGGGMGNENYFLFGTGTAATRGRTSFAEGDTDPNAPIELLNPVRGVHWIKRTARLYLRQNA